MFIFFKTRGRMKIIWSGFYSEVCTHVVREKDTVTMVTMVKFIFKDVKLYDVKKDVFDCRRDNYTSGDKTRDLD